MTPSTGPLYCPLIQEMMNLSRASNSSAGLSPLSIFTVLLHGLVSSIGILLNLLILGMVGFHIRRSIISVWILNLAASDLLATATLPFFTVFMARGKTWTMGTVFCRIHSSIFFLNMFVSGFLLATISLDRCLMVMKPVWAQNHRNVAVVWRLCGLIWLLAGLCTVPFFLFRDTIPQPSGKILCYYNYARFAPAGPFDLASLCARRQKSLALLKCSLSFLVPLLFIIISYASVSATLSRRGCRRSFRFVRLVVAVVVSFFICWAPYHLLSVIEVLVPDGSPLHVFTAKALPGAASVAFLNSILNPALYVFSCPNISKEIRVSLGAVMHGVLVEDLAEPSRHHFSVRPQSVDRGRPHLSIPGDRRDATEEEESGSPLAENIHNESIL